MKSRVSSKGQITVPIEVRERLGLRPGTVVEFVLREGSAVLRKGTDGEHPVDVVYGTVTLKRPVDESIDELRGPRPDDGGPSAPRRKRRTTKPRKGGGER